MASPMDLNDANGLDAPAGSSSAEDVNPQSAAPNAAGMDGSDPSGTEETEHHVPLKHLIQERREKKELKEQLSARDREINGYRQYVDKFEAAKPEIMQIMQKNATLTAEKADLDARLAELEQIERLAEERGIELPDKQQRENARASKAITARLDLIDQRLQQQSHQQQQQYAPPPAPAPSPPGGANLGALESEFDRQWARDLARYPELADVRDWAQEQFVAGQGKTPIANLFPRITRSAASAAAREQAERQRDGVPSPADSGGSRARPASQDPGMPVGYETMSMAEFIEAERRMRR